MTGFDNYIKIELICYTEADKDEIFALLEQFDNVICNQNIRIN